MTCPRCKCEECRREESQAVLRRFVSREGDTAELRRAFDLMPRPGRFVERREMPPVDPDAEQLALEVGKLAEELRGVA